MQLSSLCAAKCMYVNNNSTLYKCIHKQYIEWTLVKLKKCIPGSVINDFLKFCFPTLKFELPLILLVIVLLPIYSITHSFHKTMYATVWPQPI